MPFALLSCVCRVSKSSKQMRLTSCTLVTMLGLLVSSDEVVLLCCCTAAAGIRAGLLAQPADPACFAAHSSINSAFIIDIVSQPRVGRPALEHTLRQEALPVQAWPQLSCRAPA
jgi:hypothetical protein